MLTVGQIIKQLGPLAPNAATAKDRIKYWTQQQLLTPIYQHHAGTGRRRRYASHTAYEAAVLTALMDAGLHVVSRPYIKHALQLALQWRPYSRFLVIAHQTGREPIVSVQREIFLDSSTAESVVVVNLPQLFSKLDKQNA